ncbi:hypothetical protein EVAR_3695_1 [Eumeta japonica]|uniref:Uncharacterized protein n=1 Tax=Eumeta variegata TaxID=151549 RepID=A0A4C1SUM9_EUMVA|nr:hypothetical protein EVAR_3695_1 [Eumeta japonica]
MPDGACADVGGARRGEGCQPSLPTILSVIWLDGFVENRLQEICMEPLEEKRCDTRAPAPPHTGLLSRPPAPRGYIHGCRRVILS